MSNGTIKSWVKGVERRQRILNETSLMRVEFKYKIKRFPRRRSRERKPCDVEAAAARRWHDRDAALSRDHRSRRLASKLPTALHHQPTQTPQYSLLYSPHHVISKI